MSGTKGMLNYNQAIKRTPAQLYLDEHYSYAGVEEGLGSRKSVQIEAWVRMYRNKENLCFVNRSDSPKKMKAINRN